MATLENYPVKLVTGGDDTVVIEAAGTLSTSLNLIGSTILGFYFPAGFTESDITFQASKDGETFYEMKDGYSGNPINISEVAASYARVLPADFVGVNIIRLVCATPQVSRVEISVACGPIL